MNQASKKLKSVKLATWLNVFPLVFGLGYLYLGKWTRFLVVLAVQLFSLAPMTWLGLRDANRYLLLIVWIVSIFDANSQAKAHNAILAQA